MTPVNPLPAPVPVVTPETAEFWAATATGSLLLPRCRACDDVYWYPRASCPWCLGTDIAWEPAGGGDTVYSFTVCRKGGGDFAGVDAYVLAIVELDEGPRMMTNVVDCDPAAVQVGLRVRLVFHDTGADAALPRFRPA